MAPQFVCAHVRAMEGIAPGDPGLKESAAAERSIRLNTNENPFPPSPKVLQAIREVEPEMLRRYPQAGAEKFREVAAAFLGGGVSRDMIVCGNGCEDLLSIATRALVGAGGTLASPTPGYRLYHVIAQRAGAKFVGIEWGQAWSLPIDELLAAKPSAIFLCNPNDPSGTVVPREQIAKLAKSFDGAVVVDESYAEFANEDVSSVKLTIDHPNLIVIRSFSKAYSLAGLRFAYAVARAEVIDELIKIKDRFNVDAIAPLAAAAALEDQEYASMTWQQVRTERARVSRELEAVGWQVQSSQSNFVLATVPDGRGKEVFAGLKRQGILVHPLDDRPMAKLRITIGSAQENNALISGIKSLSATEKAA